MLNSQKKTDIFLVNVPWWDNFMPPCAPAVLKGIVESQGFKMRTWDSNIDLQWKICNNDIDLYNRLIEYFILSKKDFLHQNLIDRFYEHVVNEIRQQSTRYVAFSVFSVQTQKAIYEILCRLRSESDIPPIVLGGRGLSTRACLSILDILKPSEKLLNFSEIVRRRNLADHIIIGDGEDSLVNFLKGERPDLGNIHHVVSSSSLEYPFSNFDDMLLEKYSGMGGVMQLPVISSKGCVRACDFCDVGAQMTKFQSKDGARLADEIIYLSNRYNVLDFALTDSIANGNMKSLKQFCEKIAEYNLIVEQNKKITWSGNWISRPPNFIKPDFYNLLAASGCNSVTIGAEHASNKVLEAMQKKTVVEGIFFDLEHFNRVGINAFLNIITGHWSEHFDDYMKLYDFLVQTGRYIANRTILGFHLSTFAVLDKTPAAIDTSQNGLMRADDNFTSLWYTKKNPESTIKIRLARLLIILELLYNLNILDRQQWDMLKTLFSRFNQSDNDEWEKFFSIYIDKDNFRTCQASLDFMETHKTYLQEALNHFFPTMPLRLRVRTSWCFDTPPRLFIKHNKKMLFNEVLAEGIAEINLELVNDFTCESFLEIGMTNKAHDDTMVDEHGNIIKDTQIMIESLELDTIDIFKDPEFFYHQTEYEINDEKIPKVCPGFFINNCVLRIKYLSPFWKHYLSTQTYSWFIEKNKKKEIGNLLQIFKSKLKKLKY